MIHSLFYDTKMKGIKSTVEKLYESQTMLGERSRTNYLLLVPLPIIALGIAALLAVVLIFSETTINSSTIILSLTLVAIFLVLIALELVIVDMMFMRCRFETDGLYVQFPISRNRLIPWDAFQEICICYSESIIFGSHPHYSILCLALKGEKKSIYGFYKEMRYRSVFTMKYSPELCEGLKERCPYEVKDLRDSLMYKAYETKR